MDVRIPEDIFSESGYLTDCRPTPSECDSSTNPNGTFRDDICRWDAGFELWQPMLEFAGDSERKCS